MNDPQMDSPATPTRGRRTTARALLGLGLRVACAQWIPRQGWDPADGPVIPHDRFPADCSLCHLGGDWQTLRADFAFDHEQQTGTPLRGAHAAVRCLYCHNDRGPVQQFAAKGCAGCHEDVHRGQLGRQCKDCHDEQTWRPSEQIAKHDRTRFPLVGAHVAVACFRCHPGAQVGNFSGASSACEHCHAQDVARSQTFDHRAQGFDQDCQQCHRPIAWLPAAFAHPASFPLTGSHGGRRCNDCHTPATWQGLSTQCVSCHQDDYAGTTDPPHQSAGFATTCEQCHSTLGWSPAAFQHSASFPLSGGHAGRRCTDCHAGGVWAGLPTTCISCHLDAWQRTTSPNHAAAKFPTECQQCHTTNGWRPATFDHSFPISGPHRLSCIECHRTPNQFQVYSCTHCHEHSQGEMAGEHEEVSGYTWESTACVRCHPNGRK
jgi:hypothetical protein